MKKIIFIFLLLFPLSIKANDGFGIPYYFTHDKVACVIVENANEFNNGGDVFLYFNYSKEVGEKLGRPWALVESNKCYEYGGEESWTEGGKTSFGSDFFWIKTTDKNFINYLNTEAKEKYKQLPEDILEFTNGDKYYLDYKVDEDTSVSVLDDYGNNLRSRGLGGGDSIINVLGEVDWDLFNYNFGEGISGGTSISNFEKVLIFLEENKYLEEKNNLLFYQNQVSKTLNSYKNEISSIYNSCLKNIKRFETKINIKKEDLEYVRYNLEFQGTFIRFSDDRLYLFNIGQVNNLIDDSCNVKLQETHQKYINEINKKGKIYYDYVKFIEQKLNSATYEEREKYWNKQMSMGYGNLTESEKIEYFPKDLNDAITINKDVKKFELLIDNSKPKEIKEEAEIIESDSDDISVLQNIENSFSEIIEDKNYLFVLYLILPLLLIFGLYIYSNKKK